MQNLKIQKRPGLQGHRYPPSKHRKPPRLRHIVVATDLSTGGATAVDAGAEIAGHTGGRLSVISIVEAPKRPDLIHPLEPGIGEWVDSRRDWVRQKVETELDEAGIRDASVHVAVGDPATLITAFGRSFHAGLVVVGAHKPSNFERVLSGSTAERIMRCSPCPVMVATGSGKSPFKRILTAIDLTHSSRSVLDQTREMAQVDGCKVRVMYSEESSRDLWRSLTLLDPRASRQRDWIRLEGLVGDTNLPGGTQAIVLHGHSGRSVLREADSWNADLIVLGARHIRFPSKTRLGRTTRYVLRHGPRPIIVVPDY